MCTYTHTTSNCLTYYSPIQRRQNNSAIQIILRDVGKINIGIFSSKIKVKDRTSQGFKVNEEQTEIRMLFQPNFFQNIPEENIEYAK